MCGVLAGTGCSGSSTPTDLVWAVNVGGEAYVASDGTAYVADQSVDGGRIGRQELVKGSQDPGLYQSFRDGDMRVAHPLDNGLYDLTFKFTEPLENAPGARVFSVIVEDRTVIKNLDVMNARDGKVRSGLSVTVVDVAVNDGELTIRFEPSAGQPVLSGLVVRRPLPAPRGRLLWSDEFDVDGAPDADKWTPNVWPARKVNDENQAYTARPDNLRVRDGMLIIEAHKEDYEDARYTSGRIHSQGKGDVLYGRVEVRARLPAGVGTWPAIWMLPSDPFRYATTCSAGQEWQGSADCDAWPNSGEIDIMEHVGYEMNHVHGTVHNLAYYWINWEQRKGRVILDDVANTFHTYALEWTPQHVRTYVDDHLYFTYVNENHGWKAWPFDHPFHLVLNVAVGGWWGRAGGGIDDDIFPVRMEVDYVRVYELASP